MARKKKEKRERSYKRLSRVAVLPSLMTLLNLIFGFAAIHFSSKGLDDPHELWWKNPELTYFAAAAWMIFLAMICDGLDGFLARLTQGASGFGAQLDSLADMVSFGLAPAFLMLRLVESGLKDMVSPVSPVFATIPGKLIWLAATAYICCAAMRLARFNVEHSPEKTDHSGFAGLPTPAAAGVVASLVLLYSDLVPEIQAEVPKLACFGSKLIIYSLPILTMIVSLLMVSRIPYRHLINHYVRGQRSLSHLVKVFLVVLCLILKLQLTAAIAFLAYAFSSPLRKLWQKHLQSRFRHAEVQQDILQKDDNSTGA